MSGRTGGGGNYNHPQRVALSLRLRQPEPGNRERNEYYRAPNTRHSVEEAASGADDDNQRELRLPPKIMLRGIRLHSERRFIPIAFRRQFQLFAPNLVIRT